MTRQYNFTRIIDRTDSCSAKNDRKLVKKMLGVNYYDDTIPMWVADMDYECAPDIVDALSGRVKRGVFGYTCQTEAYYDSIISWYRRRHHMVIEPDWIVFSNGTVSAVRNVIRTFTQKGEGVIIQPPVYYPFETQIRETKREVVRNHLIKDNDNHYHIDLDDFEAKCKDPNNKLFIYCNPHNPTGNIWSKKITQELLKICEDNNVLFFADEIHCDLIRKESTFTSALNLRHSERIIVATAVNKTFNVAGLHITNLIMKNEGLRTKLNEYTGSIGLSPFALDATIAAYNECEEWVKQVNDVIDTNFNIMDTFIQSRLPKIKFNVPEATYLAWLDFSEYQIEEDELVVLIAEKARLILEGGCLFGDDGNGFIRMNIACPTEIVEEALQRLEMVFRV